MGPFETNIEDAMRLFVPFFVILFLSPLFLKAQTDIADQTQIFGVWTSAGSPYRINGEAIVPQGKCLVIEAGVRVEFKTGSEHDYVNPAFDLGFLRVQGCLQVRGSAQAPVIFTAQDTSGHWGIIFFDEDAADSSFLNFATIRRASFVNYLKNWLNYTGALSSVNTPFTIGNVRIENNAADGIFVKEASLQVKNCLIVRNGQNGLHALSQSDIRVINATVACNASAGFDCGVNSRPHISNSIFWANGSDLNPGEYSSVAVDYTLLQRSASAERIQAGEGNIWGKNPLFVFPDSGNFHLAFNSPAVNAGRPDTSGLGLSPTDVEGAARIAHQRIDMGALERQQSFLRLVRPNGNETFVFGKQEKISWQTDLANVTLQYSLDDGQSWQEMASLHDQTHWDWLVPAEYSENAYVRVLAENDPAMFDASDTSLILADHMIVRDGIAVFGTWDSTMSPVEIRGRARVPQDSLLRIGPGVRVELKAGTEFNAARADFDAGFLHVKGALQALGALHDSVTFTTLGAGYWGTLLFDEADSGASTLDFVKIENAAGVDSVEGQNYPAALSLNASALEIAHCEISRNRSSGIVLNGESTPAIHNCRINDNEGTGVLLQNANHFPKAELFENRVERNHRHGIWLQGSSAAYLHDNVVEHNDSTGILLQTGYATPRLENNRIGYTPTGISCDYSTPKIVGDVVYHCQKGLAITGANPDLGNVTLADNETAIGCTDASPVLTNVLFGRNNRDFDFANGDNSAPTVSFSLSDKAYFPAQVLDAGFNRLGVNPGFSGIAPHPYALKKGSPAIDRGTTENSLITLPESDVAGHPRILDGNHDGTKQIDIGAYEFAELTAGFRATPTSGAVPLTVRFYDESVGNVDTWHWAFGDGAQSTEANPSHTYERAGKFTVRLAIRGEAGQDSLVRPDYIYVKYPPFVCRSLPDTAFFEDSGWHLLRNLQHVFCDSDSTTLLTFGATSSSAHLLTRWQGDSLFVKGDSNFNGAVRLCVTAKDEIGLKASDTCLVSVLPVNDVPYREKPLPDSLVFTSDSTVRLKLWEYYGDVETADSLLQFVLTAKSDSVQVFWNASGGTATISCVAGFSGRTWLFISVTDDSGAGLHDSLLLKIKRPTAVGAAALSHLPRRFFMSQNYPNPFNPVTTIRYALPVAQNVTLELIDLRGRRKMVFHSGWQQPGWYVFRLDTRRWRLASGVYFIFFHSQKFRAFRKIVLLK